MLVPAALGEVITEDNAERIRAEVVLEAANYPVTPSGDKILGDRGITVIPDILANAGGVTGSYFEWTQNIQQFTWKEERFNAELLDKMQGAYRFTQAFADDKAVHAAPGRLRHRHQARRRRRQAPRLHLAVEHVTPRLGAAVRACARRCRRPR